MGKRCPEVTHWEPPGGHRHLLTSWAHFTDEAASEGLDYLAHVLKPWGPSKALVRNVDFILRTKGSHKAGVPNLWAVGRYWSAPVRNQAAQQEVSLNVMLLDHPETIPPHPRPWKNSSMKPVPGAKKVGDRCRRAFKWEKEVLELALSRLSVGQ